MGTLIIASIAAFLLSLLGRLVADAVLTARVPILGEWVGLQLVRNAGVAFGMTFPAVLQFFLVTAALLLVLALAYQSRRQPLPAISFGLILGGALANVVDRLGDGLVTDFFQIGAFPTFNVADSCITVGVGILLLRGLLWRSAKPEDVL